jgi:phage FluMu protein Com
VVHLAPDKTDAGTLWLIAEGNAIPKTTMTFTIREDFRLERTETPARTKEEKAARLILGELAMRPEGMAYGDMVALVREVGLTETEGAAKRLVDRVLSQLAGRMTCKQDRRRRIYRLKDQPDLSLSKGDRPPSGAPDGQERLATSDNNIDFVANVANPQNANKNGDLISDRISDNPLTVVANPQGEATPIGDISDKSDKGSVVANVANVANPSASGVIGDNSDNAYIDVACRQCEAVSETYPANAPQPNQPKLVDAPITLTPNPTSSDEVRYIDTKKWLGELCAELNEASNKPPDDTSLTSPTKPDRLACLCGGELRLFGKFYQCLRCDSPRAAPCRNCGKVLQLTSDGHAECVGCGLLYTFDRARRLWLSDLDAF